MSPATALKIKPVAKRHDGYLILQRKKTLLRGQRNRLALNKLNLPTIAGKKFESIFERTRHICFLPPTDIMNGQTKMNASPPGELWSLFHFVAKFDGGSEEQCIEYNRFPRRKKVDARSSVSN